MAQDPDARFPWLLAQAPLVLGPELMVTAEEAQALSLRIPAQARAVLDQRLAQIDQTTPLHLTRSLPLADPSKAPGPEDWLADGQTQPGPQMAVTELLRAAGLLGKTEQLPWAALMARGHGLPVAPGQHWMALTPTQLIITPNQVSLSPRPAHALRPDQLMQLQALLADEGQLVVHEQAEQIFLKGDGHQPHQVWRLQALHPDFLEGQHMPAFEPLGDDLPRWRLRSNEIQMAWHALGGDTQANGLWAWGAGTWPTASADQASAQADGLGPINLPGTRATDPAWLVGLRAWLLSRGQRPWLVWQPMTPIGETSPAQAWAEAWLDLLAELQAHPEASLITSLRWHHAHFFRGQKAGLLPKSQTALRPVGLLSPLQALWHGWQRRRHQHSRPGSNPAAEIRLRTLSDLLQALSMPA